MTDEERKLEAFEKAREIQNVDPTQFREDRHGLPMDINQYGYGGDHRVRTLSCAEQYRSMAFAQLTYRESLRDIETCLSVHASKLYHMGFRQPVRRSTLADANERRDWRIHAALAQRLITQARTLYVDEELGLDLTNTVYALDSTTIALCLSVFPRAHFRTTKAAVKMHTLLDLRGNIPSFIHISDGKLHDVHALDMLLPEAGAISGLGGWEAVCSEDGKIEAHASRPGGFPVMGDKPLHPTGEAAGEANSESYLPSLKSEDKREITTNI